MSTKLEWKAQPMGDGQMIFSSVTPDEIAKLQELAAGKDVLEVGSAYGYSAIRMAEVAAHVDAVDPHAGELAGSYEAMTTNLAQYGVQHKVTIIRDYSQSALPRLVAEGKHYDLVFIDGNHDQQVQNDIACAWELLESGGWLCVHDYDQYDFPVIKDVMDAQLGLVEVVDSLWVGRAL